jgi:hypothetical protein
VLDKVVVCLLIEKERKKNKKKERKKEFQQKKTKKVEQKVSSSRLLQIYKRTAYMREHGFSAYIDKFFREQFALDASVKKPSAPEKAGEASEWMSRDEVCDVLNIVVGKLYRWHKKGILTRHLYKDILQAGRSNSRWLRADVMRLATAKLRGEL